MVHNKSFNIVIGGLNNTGELETVERYDLRVKKIEYVAEMNERRSGASAAAHDGKIYVVGGYNGDNHLDTIEMFVFYKFLLDKI